MDILDDMGVSKVSAKVFLKVNYSFNVFFGEIFYFIFFRDFFFQRSTVVTFKLFLLFN